MSTSVPSTADRMFHIGELAERVSLSLRTVRYYEEMGLVRPLKRTEGGFRLFTEEHVQRLLLIRQMKPLGFSVEEMCELLDARDVLEDASSTEPETAAAQERLAGFATAAAERVERLREQLAVAEAFADTLRRPRRSTRSRAASDA